MLQEEGQLSYRTLETNDGGLAVFSIHKRALSVFKKLC